MAKKRRPRYLHQQIGWAVLVAVLGVSILVYFALVGAGLGWLGVILLLVPLLVSVLFGSMMVSVDQSHVRIRFGAGLVRRSWELGSIASVEQVRNPWYTGWGIRYLPGRTVYNVAGFDAVEIQLKNGKRYRIGTDEPAALERAIRTGINAR